MAPRTTPLRGGFNNGKPKRLKGHADWLEPDSHNTLYRLRACPGHTERDGEIIEHEERFVVMRGLLAENRQCCCETVALYRGM